MPCSRWASADSVSSQVFASDLSMRANVFRGRKMDLSNAMTIPLTQGLVAYVYNEFALKYYGEFARLNNVT